MYADATHLNPASRAKVINKLKYRPDEINVIYKKVSLEMALERNNKRKGIAVVPDEVIKSMYAGFLEPQDYEDIDNVYIIEE